MVSEGGGRHRPGLVARIWRFLWRPSAAVAAGILLILGFAGGIVFLGGVHLVLEQFSTEAFCISCHEMEDHSFADLKDTIHFVNRTGTRATCVDCHVPREFFPKIGAKIIATKDLFFHFTGKIDTPEKYEAHRLEMALRVWHEMKARDSHECRNCHQRVWIDTSAEFGGAARHHEAALKNGNMTCVDCHQGIAHTLPKEFERPTLEQLEQNTHEWLDKMDAAAAASK